MTALLASQNAHNLLNISCSKLKMKLDNEYFKISNVLYPKTLPFFAKTKNPYIFFQQKLSTLDCVHIRRFNKSLTTVKILKIGTPEIITITVLQLKQLDFTVQYCVQKMQTE